MIPKQLSLPCKFINIESYTEIWIPSRHYGEYMEDKTKVPALKELTI